VSKGLFSAEVSDRLEAEENRYAVCAGLGRLVRVINRRTQEGANPPNTVTEALTLYAEYEIERDDGSSSLQQDQVESLRAILG